MRGIKGFIQDMTMAVIVVAVLTFCAARFAEETVAYIDAKFEQPTYVINGG